MLIEFRVANHRSIRAEQALSLTASPKLGDGNDDRPRSVGHTSRLLPVAALYGANASGKSNLLSAIVFMRDAVVMSHRSWPPEGGIPRDPFAWGALRNEPSVFEADFLQAGIRFQYGFVVNDECVLEEWLYAWPSGSKQTWLERDGQTFGTVRNASDLSRMIDRVTRPNALFLSTAAQLQLPEWALPYSWFTTIESVNLQVQSPRRSRYFGSNDFALTRLIERASAADEPLPPDNKDIKALARFREFVKDADIGVIDFRTIKDDSDVRPPRVQLRHSVDEPDAWLPLEEESKGTKTLCRIAMPIFRAIDNGSVILIDEIESSLHPKIAEAIVKQFNSPDTNPRNAQLIFTTHDTNLLGNTAADPALRRDEVWLTEKDSHGGSVLYPLTNFKPRKAENIERGYLQGRYSAIPFLGNFTISEDEKL